MTFKSCVVPQQVHCTKQGHHISYRQQRRKINSITKWIYPPKNTHTHYTHHTHTHTQTHHTHIHTPLTHAHAHRHTTHTYTHHSHIHTPLTHTHTSTHHCSKKHTKKTTDSYSFSIFFR